MRVVTEWETIWTRPKARCVGPEPLTSTSTDGGEVPLETVLCGIALVILGEASISVTETTDSEALWSCLCNVRPDNVSDSP
jgi:hypothetical protein